MEERLNPIQIRNLRKMTGEKRLNILDELYEFSRSLITSSIKENLPNISERELQEKTNRRMVSLTNPERP